MADERVVTTTSDGERTRLAVDGMTCSSCEARVEKALLRLDSVAAATASARRGSVEIAWREDEDAEAAAAALARAGYRVGHPRWLTRDRAVWRTFGAAALVVGLLVVAAQLAGWSTLSSGVGDLATGGLAVVLLLGLAAGVSTCMALTGGLVLALSAAHAARLSRADPRAVPGALTRLRPVLLVNVGRVVGFTILGAALGLVGASTTIPTQVLAAMMLAVALVMAVLGVRLTELSPRIAGWTVSLPSSWAGRLRLDSRAGSGYTDLRAAGLGAATFFLPCGFTQAAQIFALSTGSAAYSAAIMGVFALGTAPGLLTLGGLPQLLPARRRDATLRGIGVLVLLFAAVNGASGLRLIGVDPFNPLPREALSTTATSNVEVLAGRQVLHTVQVTDGYLPVRTTIYSGTPISWVVDSQDPQSCAVALRAPTLGVSINLTRGLNTIELPAQPVGRIAFSCSMGMYGGTIDVVAPPLR
jgi:sulfite exporter TauE/SafE/copper chaperone CopZ